MCPADEAGWGLNHWRSTRAPVQVGIGTSSRCKRAPASPPGGHHKPQIGRDSSGVSEGTRPAVFLLRHVPRPLGPAGASPDRQIKCWKDSLKSFASYLKALGTRLHGPADLARISCWILPRGEVRLQGQAVDKTAQSAGCTKSGSRPCLQSDSGRIRNYRNHRKEML